MLVALDSVFTVSHTPPMSAIDQSRAVKILLLERPSRKLVIRRAVGANDYFSYCSEVGCEDFDKTWGEFQLLSGTLGEPMGLWLPDALVRPGSSTYVIGIEVPMAYDGALPEGTEVIELPPTTFVVFHAPPGQTMFEDVRNAISRYDPNWDGCSWDKATAPTFQFAPDNERGYIEGHPIRK